jgi:hypothetical protein
VLRAHRRELGVVPLALLAHALRDLAVARGDRPV